MTKRADFSSMFCILFTTWTGVTQRVVRTCLISVQVWRGPEVSEEENMNSVNSSCAWQQDNTEGEKTCKMKLLFHCPWRMLWPSWCFMLKLIIWFPNLEDLLYILVEVNMKWHSQSILLLQGDISEWNGIFVLSNAISWENILPGGN